MKQDEIRPFEVGQTSVPDVLILNVFRTRRLIFASRTFQTFFVGCSFTGSTFAFHFSSVGGTMNLGRVSVCRNLCADRDLL